MWDDPFTKPYMATWLSLLCLLIALYTVWKQQWIKSWLVKWVISLGLSLIVFLQPLSRTSDWKALEEINLSVQDIELLSIDEQLDVFIYVASFHPTHPIEALGSLASIIGSGGEEAILPTVWTIKSYMPLARLGNERASKIVFWLPLAFVEAKESRTDLEGTAAEILINDLICDEVNSSLAVFPNVEGLFFEFHFDVAESMQDAYWQERVCNSIGY